ncbi:MAG TPA: methyltransferase domain-containing protein [Pyrinomonadaceae bacterium]|jgi:ubiquinone/menaquinone biosynthesis C-methylase UbiE
MTKTQKELAFLRDLYVDNEWTQRFTDLVDKHIGFAEEEKLLYINAGTGNHALALSKKLGKTAEFFATAENEDVLTIARDKAVAVKANIDFSMNDFEDETFSGVIADASFVRPGDLADFVAEAARVTETAGKVVFFTPSAGSFGEVFSLLWEVCFNEDMGEHGALSEHLITEIPTVSRIEEIAKNAGLEAIETHTQNEIFEYQNGAEFIGAPLVADFLLPVWLKTLSEKDQAKATDKLAKLIDDEDQDLTFRFTVKATLVIGEKE